MVPAAIPVARPTPVNARPAAAAAIRAPLRTLLLITLFTNLRQIVPLSKASIVASSSFAASSR